jgi:aryl-alcohol dehydrogenase-like predicted oxidoreductase
LQRLRLPRLKAYLAHDSAALKNATIREQLAAAKDKGLVGQFGVSVYFPDELHELMDCGIPFDIVQLPLNVFDQRFRPMLPELKGRGVEVHIRSVFLQGLFFLEPDELSPHFDRVHPKLAALRRLVEEHRVPLSALLLNYAMAQPGVDRVVIGVTGADELREDLAAEAHAARCRELLPELDALAVSDEGILVASNWR